MTGLHGTFNAQLATGNVAAFGTQLFTISCSRSRRTTLLLIVAMVGAVAPGSARRGKDGRVVTPGPDHFLILSAILFTLGALGVLTRRDPLIMFMSIELMLNSVNLTFVTFSHYLSSADGQIFVFIIMTVAAAEVVVGLGTYRLDLPDAPADRRRRTRRDEGLAACSILLGILLLPCSGSSSMRLATRFNNRAVSLVGRASSAGVRLRRHLLCLAAGPARRRHGTTTSSAGHWTLAGTFHLKFGLLLDPLSSIMTLVVTGVGFLILVYSVGYMRDEPSGLPPLLRSDGPLHLHHAAAGPGRQLSLAAGRLGRRRPHLVPADRLLLRATRRRWRRPAKRSS